MHQQISKSKLILDVLSEYGLKKKAAPEAAQTAAQWDAKKTERTIDVQVSFPSMTKVEDDSSSQDVSFQGNTFDLLSAQG